MRRSLSAMPHCFCDPRLRMAASTSEAPLLGQHIPVAAFSRGAGVSPGLRSRQRIAPARNRPEVQDPWRNRRPFPAKPPRIRSGATAGEAAAADEHEHVAKRMLAPDAPQTIARKRSWKTPVEPVPAPTKSNPQPPPPTHQKSPWQAAIPRSSIVKYRQQISHGKTVPCVAKPPQVIREITP